VVTYIHTVFSPERACEAAGNLGAFYIKYNLLRFDLD
jgi:hypothetical protein